VVRRIRSGRRGTPNLGSYSAGVSYYDAFRRKLIPSDETLIREYKRTAYACANLNAVGLTNISLKLYVKSDKGDKKTILRTKSLSSKRIDWLCSQSYLSKSLRSFVNVEEVVTHPVLDLLRKANDTPFMNGVRLSELTQLYQEITGKAYWLITNNVFGIPENIWLIPSQYMYPYKEPSSRSKTPIDYYEYIPPGVSEPIEYNVNDIIPFYMPSLTNPYVEGLSPLEAAFEANEVNNKLLTHQDALLENEARPDAMITPGKETAFGPEEAERYEKQFRMRFARGRQGGVWVVEDDVNFTPIAFPPQDLARLEINKWSKNDLANAFQVPFALVADASHNREQLEAAERQHAKYGLSVRCARDAAVKNDLLISRYDDSGRLFLAYDDPIPENKEEKLQENVQLGMNGFKTPNEIRKDYNLPPVAGGDELRAINVSPEMMRDNERKNGNAEK